jgi:hypothetical protein
MLSKNASPSLSPPIIHISSYRKCARIEQWLQRCLYVCSLRLQLLAGAAGNAADPTMLLVNAFVNALQFFLLAQLARS